MDNYLVLNGKRIDLTKEQIEQLGLEIEKKSPFARVKNENYFFIGCGGRIDIFNDNQPIDERLFKIANYCTDKEIMTARAKEEVLSRLLWRFSMENGGDKIDWNDNIQKKFFIYKYTAHQEWITIYNTTNLCLGMVYFISQQIAQRAIDEIVKPFYAGELEVCKIWEE